MGLSRERPNQSKSTPLKCARGKPIGAATINAEACQNLTSSLELFQISGLMPRSDTYFSDEREGSPAAPRQKL